MGYIAKLTQHGRKKGVLAGKHQIEIEYRYKGGQSRYRVENVYCFPQEWNSSTQQVGSGYEKKVLKDMNDNILLAKEKIAGILKEAAVKDVEPTHGFVKEMWNRPIQQNTKLLDDVCVLYEEWMYERGVPKYTTTLPHIQSFAAHRGGLKAMEVSKALLTEFCNYLCKTGYEPHSRQIKKEVLEGVKKRKTVKKSKKKNVVRLPFSNTSIKNHIKYFTLFIKEYLVEKEYEINQNFRDYSSKFSSPEILDVVALTKAEFDTLFYFQVPEDKPHLHLTKIAFIIGTALGGLRISDLKKLTAQSFRNNTVRFRQGKTGGKVENPISSAYAEPFLEEFLEKKKSIPSGQKFNTNLKTLAKMAGLDRVETLEQYKAGKNKPISVDVNINEHISSKYMRKSFISMLVELGVEREIIMSFSGHESAKVIQHYIQVHKHTKQEVLDTKFVPDPRYNTAIKPVLSEKEIHESNDFRRSYAVAG